MGRPVKVKRTMRMTVGSRGEYQPNGYGRSRCPYPHLIGEPALVLSVDDLGRAVIRFEECGTELEAWVSYLTWLPTVAQIEAGKRRFKAAYFAERRGCDSLAKSGRWGAAG